jgi:hypothetical protein
LMAWSPAGAQETTQEILVGYNSEADRRAGEKELAGAKDKLKVRGQSLESLRVQPISDKALKLQIGLPAALKAEATRTPAVGASILKELADQLKQADKRIVYAHPNWIMSEATPMARAAPPPASPKERVAAAQKDEPKETAAAPAQKKTKRAAKRTKTRVAHKRGRSKHAARHKCRCSREVAWAAPCGKARVARRSSP